jgi:glycosyltransferase involved in cell wall biosynthesis
MIKLSCIIPSYKDPLLHKTIDSLLENSELPKNELEIVVVLDGYEPEKPIINDPRVKVFRQENKGMREAINRAVRESHGEFIMRLDEHQMVGPGYDRILTRDCQDNWIMTPRRYHLDVEKWEIMYEIAPIDYDRLAIQQSRQKFTGVESRGTARERKDIMIDETFGMQGSCWIMKRSWWDKVIKELDTKNYGPLYNDSIEMIFKTWKAGGKLMVNKNTWHAHKHRKFKRTHNDGSPENPSRKEEGFAYALNTWKEYFDEINGKTINVWPPISQ